MFQRNCPRCKTSFVGALIKDQGFLDEITYVVAVDCPHCKLRQGDFVVGGADSPEWNLKVSRYQAATVLSEEMVT